MPRIAKEQVSLWPRGVVAVDLAPMAGRLMQDLAIGLLFGDQGKRARPITTLMECQFASWPSNIRNYLVWLPVASRQERLIMEWAEQKRGNLDPKDILSIIVNNPDEYGLPSTRDIIGGLMTFIFGAAYETCQNALIWALILLTQHPQVAARERNTGRCRPRSTYDG